VWRRRRTKPDSEDSAVAAVERILANKVPALQVADLVGRGQANANNALWICACVTIDESPIWLIYDTPEGQLAWLRVPDRMEPLPLVNAAHTAGGHADPAGVLDWLLGEAPGPWSGGGDGSSDPGVLDELLMKIRQD
jgi:hypothetical protein